MQEVYGPPIKLCGFYSHTMIPINEIKSYEENKMFIHTQVQYDFSTCLVYREFREMQPKWRPLIKSGFMTTLTVTIPKDPHHSLWHLEDPQESEVHDTLSFEVRRWGQTKDESYKHALQRATDIIQYIRTAVTSGGSPGIPPLFGPTTLTLTSNPCVIYQLGTELCSMWKDYSKTFSKDSKMKRKNASRLLQAIQEKHDSDVYICARPVLQYYKVYLLTLFLIDVRPTSKWSLESMATPLTYLRIYLSTYSTKPRDSHGFLTGNFHSQYMNASFNCSIYLKVLMMQQALGWYVFRMHFADIRTNLSRSEV
jgi:hypothetical protein